MSLQGGGEVIVRDGPHSLSGCKVYIPPGKNRGVSCLDATLYKFASAQIFPISSPPDSLNTVFHVWPEQ